MSTGPILIDKRCAPHDYYVTKFASVSIKQKLQTNCISHPHALCNLTELHVISKLNYLYVARHESLTPDCYFWAASLLVWSTDILWEWFTTIRNTSAESKDRDYGQLGSFIIWRRLRNANCLDYILDEETTLLLYNFRPWIVKPIRSATDAVLYWFHSSFI